MEQSYDFQNLVRDLSPVVSTIVKNIPGLISIIPFAGTAYNNKHEWLNDTFAPQGGTLAEDLDTVETAVDVADGTKFAVGQIIQAGDSPELMKITAIATNTLTVTRSYGGSTATAVLNGAAIKVVAKPVAGGSNQGDDLGAHPVADYNYTQIFRADAIVPGDVMKTPQYGVSNELDRQVAYHTQRLLWDLNRSLIYGYRVARASGDNGMMGGVNQFVSTTVAGGGVAITEAKLNDAIEAIALNGGRANVILCNTNQARKISALNKGTSLQVMRSDTATGGYVSAFVSDLPNNTITTVVVDSNYPKDQVALLDTSRISIVPYNGRGFQDSDATSPGFDGVARKIIGEYTAEIRNAGTAHARITGLLA